VRSFKRSRDPRFADKLADIVGLYLIRPRTRWCCRSTRKDPMGTERYQPAQSDGSTTHLEAIDVSYR
jgi:hypothetical protein